MCQTDSNKCAVKVFLSTTSVDFCPHGRLMRKSYFTAIEYAQQQLDKLESESSDLIWKVSDIVDEVDDLRCGFDSLKDDM